MGRGVVRLLPNTTVMEIPEERVEGRYAKYDR
jgi:hypothetical protein